MTKRYEVEEWARSLSILDHSTASVTQINYYNGWSLTGGFTPRRTFNTASVTTSQLAEAFATLLDDLHKKR